MELIQEMPLKGSSNVQESTCVKESEKVLESIETSDKGMVHIVSISTDSRFTQWLKALKIRYWVDFGNQDKYRVDWIRKTSSTGELVDLVIQLFQLSDGGGKDQLLFTLTAYLNKRKLMVQGNYKDMWKETEFVKLRNLVNGLSSDESLEYAQIISLYDSVFQEDGHTMHNYSGINLDGVSLDIFEDSDNEEDYDVDSGKESEGLQPIVASPKRKSPKVKPSRRIVKKSTVMSAKKTRKRVFSNGWERNSEPQKLMEIIESCNNRISRLEDVVAKTDQVVAKSLFQVNVINNNLTSSKQELVTSLNDRLKHELVVLRKAQDGTVREVEERMAKAESQIKKLQGRVGSLVEEKTNLLKRVKTLEDENKILQLRYAESESRSVEERSETIETVPERDPPRSADTIKSDAQDTSEVETGSTNGNESDTQDTSEVETGSTNGNESDTQDTSEVETGTNGNKSHQRPFNHDFVILCDSNRKYLDLDKLCPNHDTWVIPCGTTGKAIDILKSPRFTVNRGLIVNTGVNDVEHLSIQEVISKQVDMIHAAVSAFPGEKIILSSITPRRDELDKAVFEVNTAVHEQTKDLSNVIHIDDSQC